MPELFELLKSGPHAGFRPVLGHFFFVYIHPHMDRNGRMRLYTIHYLLVVATHGQLSQWKKGRGICRLWKMLTSLMILQILRNS